MKLNLKHFKTSQLIKGNIINNTVSPGTVFGCESYSMNKADRTKIYSFEMWCWKRELNITWTAGKTHQLVVDQINPECSVKVQVGKQRL